MATHNEIKYLLNRISFFNRLGRVKYTTFLTITFLLFATEALNQGYKTNHLPPEVPLQQTENNDNNGNH